MNKKYSLLFFLSTGLIFGSDEIEKPEKPSLTWHGSLSNTGSILTNTTFLNKTLPDTTNWFRTTFDLKGDLRYGQETFGHDAVKASLEFRHKQYWGADAVKTEKETITISNATTAGHSHAVSKPPLWMYSIWGDFSLDAFGNKGIKSEGLNRLKIGMFPFELGRGICLGSDYGISQDFLGIAIKANDFFVPALMFYGELPNKKFEYQFYYGRPQARGATIRDTLAFNKQHIVSGTDFFRGSFKDDGILAGQVKFKHSLQGDREINFFIQPYALYFWTPEQKVVMDADSRFNLVTVGLSSEFESKNFEFGYDLGLNFGKQIVQTVDQNSIILETDATTGSHVEKFSHIVDPATDLAVLATDNLKAELLTNDHRDGVAFTAGGLNYQSKSDRISQGYKNDYRGQMLVFDGSYNASRYPLKLTTIFGYASGDVNPNTVKEDGTYHGFVGINETYSSKRVPSVIILGGASVRRPLSLQNGKTELKNFAAGAFTDLKFVGGGITLMPPELAFAKGVMSLNVLGFWKDHKANKVSIDSDTGEVSLSNDLASRYLGVEFNCISKFMLMDNLALSFKSATFIPGQYYHDISGATLGGEQAKLLKALDKDKLDASGVEYKLGTSHCYLFSMDLSYKF